MGKLKKWHIATIVIASVIVVVGVAALSVWLVIFKNYERQRSLYESIDGFERMEWRIGTTSYASGKETNTIASNKIFNGEDFENVTLSSSDGSILEFDGNRLTVKKAGKVKVTATKNDGTSATYDIIATDGVNIFTASDLKKAIQAKKPVIIQNELKLNERNYEIYNDMYGNAYKIDATAKGVGYYDALFSVRAKNVLLQDLNIMGADVGKDEVEMNAFGSGGILVEFVGDDDGSVSGQLLHCMLENAQRCVFIRKSDVTIKGCLIRNASDACVSIESFPGRGSDIIVENNVISNGTVAGILLWCMNSISNDADYAKLTIRGFLDIYNWKSTDAAQIVPDSEDSADLVNGLIGSELKKDKYNDYFYKENGNKYLHCGIIVTDTKNENNAVQLNNINKINFEQRNFPSELVSAYLKACKVYGYDKKVNIKPSQKITDNKMIFGELMYGRLK